MVQPAPVNENVFAKPWKKSDVVLVVQETEFHVHRSILTIQSPVFEAMFNEHFKEANQEKITLEGKTSEDMLQFLKLLYPPNMIKKPMIPFSGENVFKILVLADEYQAEDVLNQCLENTKIIPDNALRLLPYAVKYNQSVREKCIDVIKRRIAIDKVEKEFSELDNKLTREILTTKCRYLESIALRGMDLLTSLLEKIVSRASLDSCVRKIVSSASQDSYGRKIVSSASLDSFGRRHDPMCSHTLDVSEFRRARSCKHCLLEYTEQFIEKATSGPKWSKREILNLLIDIDDVLQ